MSKRRFLMYTTLRGCAPEIALVESDTRIHETCLTLLRDATTEPVKLEWAGDGFMASAETQTVQIELFQINLNSVSEYQRHYPNLQPHLQSWADERRAA